MMTRRRFLAFSLGATALALIPAGLSAAQPQGAAIGTIRVEFAPAVAHVWNEDALRLVRSELQQTLAEILGPGFQRGGGDRIVVTIGSLWLASDAGGGGGGRPSDGGGTNDYLESTVVVYDRVGRQLNNWPIRSTETSSGIAWYRPDADQLRLAALARNNAWWIKHYIQG